MQVANRIAAAERACAGWTKHLGEESALEIGRVSKPEERRPVVPVVVIQTLSSVAADEIQRCLGRSRAGWRSRVEKIVRAAGDTKDVLRIGNLNSQSVRNRRYALPIPAHA